VNRVRGRLGEETSAGGVVWHKGRVLVLRNFRDEYIFPKGHLEAGETAEQAALREVAEETGLLATIVSQLPDTTYSYQKVYGGLQEKRIVKSQQGDTLVMESAVADLGFQHFVLPIVTMYSTVSSCTDDFSRFWL